MVTSKKYVKYNFSLIGISNNPGVYALFASDKVNKIFTLPARTLYEGTIPSE